MGVVEKVDLQDGLVLSPVQIDGDGVQPIVVSLAVVLVVDGTHVQDPDAAAAAFVRIITGGPRCRLLLSFQ